MKRNICRQIIFYNNFIPPTRMETKWDYLAFGTFDGVFVGEPIAENSSRKLLNRTWNKQREFLLKLDGKYAFQEEYIFCYEEEEKEKKFWETEEYPFTFFCHLQFQGDLKSLRENNLLAKKIGEETAVIAQTYTTYNNTDILLIVKSESYEDGAGVIASLHKGINFSEELDSVCKLRNSFTVFAIKSSFINNIYEEDRYNRLNQIKIDCVIVRLIEREGKDIEPYIIEIQKEVSKSIGVRYKDTPMLGEDDEVILIQNIGWGDFLALYREREGILHHENLKYRECVAGITTIISTQVYIYDLWKKIQLNGVGNLEDSGAKCISYINDMRKSVRKLDKYNGDSNFKELYIILNALPKFFEEKFPDYLFFPVLRPLNTLIDLLNDGDNSHYYEFIKSFNIYVQSSVKTDKNSMQILDFNAKIYDVPSKMHAFYIAYIYHISKILNISDEKKYTII